jgi:hypothetical protein
MQSNVSGCRHRTRRGIGTAIGVALGHVGPWIAIGAGIGVAISYSCAPKSKTDQAQNPTPKV